MRVTKKHDVRLNEILDAAEQLFIQKGYEKATVNDILNKVEIAKGTFYHYFKSKEEVMNGVINRMVDHVVHKAEKIADDENMRAQEKLQYIILSLNISKSPDAPMIEELHETSNAQMHQESIVRTIRGAAPILAKVVQEGIDEGVFHTDYPLETVEFLMAANQFIFDAGIFQWKEEEIKVRMAAFIHIMEVVLGAEKGSFSYIEGLIAEGRDETNEK